MTDSELSLAKYVDAMAVNNFVGAKQYLMEAVFAAKKVDARPVLAGLAQRFGAIAMKEGDKVGAIVFYEFSELLDADSLLAKLDYAKFLFLELGDAVSAQAKCNEIIEMANANPFPASNDDFGSKEYIEAAKRIIEKAKCD